MKRFVLLSFLAVVFLAACPKPKIDVGTPGVTKVKNNCMILPRGCAGGPEDTGCPDTIIEVGDNCTLTAQGVQDLQRAADEMLNDRDVTRLAIISPSMTCSNIVRAHFEQRGVPEWRLHVVETANRTFINFQVDAWKEKSCADNTVVKPPGGSVY